jgi:uncharacterized protein (DUF427 family)
VTLVRTPASPTSHNVGGPGGEPWEVVMGTRLQDIMRARLSELRHEQTEKWVRAFLARQPVLDSTRALLVWEPRRVVPSYAVPVADLAATLVPTEAAPPSTAPVLHPGIPFAVHSAPGTSFDLVIGDRTLPNAGFEPAELAGHVVVNFNAFDAWREEEDEIVAHPRDPYQRVDVRPSSRRVQISRGGDLLADSSRPVLVFETMLMTRFYLPREDVIAELLPSSTRTSCAYKGHATYHSVRGCEDVAWTYLDPLPDMSRLAGLVAFFDEKVDVTVDGVRRDGPTGIFADAMRDEFGLPSAQ